MKIQFTHIVMILFILVFSNCRAVKAPEQSVATKKEVALSLEIDSLQLVIKSLRKKLEPPIYDPDRVYVRCRYVTQLETTKSDKFYIIYTGNDSTQDGVEKRQVITRTAYNQWKKIKHTDICPEADGLTDEECELWFYEEIKPVYDTIYTVIDTNKIKDFVKQKIDVVTVVKEGSLSRFQQHMGCRRVKYSIDYGDIQNALRKSSYRLDGVKEGVFDSITKNALMEYQKNNGLSVGQLDLETSKHLGIKNE